MIPIHEINEKDLREVPEHPHVFIKTSVAAVYLHVAHNTLNKMCRLALKGQGHLSAVPNLIYKDGYDHWWVRADVDEHLYLPIAGKGGFNSHYFAPVSCVVQRKPSQ